MCGDGVVCVCGDGVVCVCVNGEDSSGFWPTKKAAEDFFESWKDSHK